MCVTDLPYLCPAEGGNSRHDPGKTYPFTGKKTKESSFLNLLNSALHPPLPKLPSHTRSTSRKHAIPLIPPVPGIAEDPKRDRSVSRRSHISQACFKLARRYKSFPRGSTSFFIADKPISGKPSLSRCWPVAQHRRIKTERTATVTSRDLTLWISNLSRAKHMLFSANRLPGNDLAIPSSYQISSSSEDLEPSRLNPCCFQFPTATAIASIVEMIIGTWEILGNDAQVFVTDQGMVAVMTRWTEMQARASK
ncbi:hypothetical protein B0O99DRAFT_598647 [Bisporella sp. PMI_857]|nr:hypothetical protein B0O99DRAFT_598647 [Bisporella sp. PMI_857]